MSADNHRPLVHLLWGSPPSVFSLHRHAHLEKIHFPLIKFKMESQEPDKNKATRTPPPPHHPGVQL